jgi:hypothetical protein
VKSPQSNPTPNWKHVILATHDWPDDLVVPQNDPLPEESEPIQDSMSTKENWEWELWRHAPDTRRTLPADNFETPSESRKQKIESRDKGGRPGKPPKAGGDS